MQNYFNELIDKLTGTLGSDEFLLANLIGEASDFVRLNHNRIRQSGNVVQTDINLDLISGKHHSASSCSLAGDLESDFEQLCSVLNSLREQLAVLPEDPYLNYATSVSNTESIAINQIPDTKQSLDYIMKKAETLDLVGIWASGEQYHGFANSAGQRNWFSKPSFNFDWSVYHKKDKAVKNDYAGFEWQEDILDTKMESTREALKVLANPAKQLTPGKYRVYLAPTALNEILGMTAWGGYGLKSHRTSQTPLIQMVTGDKKLHESINITENHKGGLVPGFTSDGFLKPDRVSMIVEGRFNECLVNARSAQEFSQRLNSSSEYPNSIELSAGHLKNEDILKTLDTGIYISNLWYCNFSDRDSCRITGMTRYACFWVENGKIIAPINVMRFDESIYNILGSELLSLTSEREFIFDSGSYGFRSNGSANLPGALVNNFTLTL